MLANAERADMTNLAELCVCEQNDFAAGTLDLVGSRLREGVRGHGHGFGQVTVAEDLDPIEAALDQSSSDQLLDVDGGARRKNIEIAHVDFGRARGERVSEAALG